MLGIHLFLVSWYSSAFITLSLLPVKSVEFSHFSPVTPHFHLTAIVGSHG